MESHTDSSSYPDSSAPLAPDCDSGMGCGKVGVGWDRTIRLSRERSTADLATSDSHCFYLQKYFTCFIYREFVSCLWATICFKNQHNYLRLWAAWKDLLGPSDLFCCLVSWSPHSCLAMDALSWHPEILLTPGVVLLVNNLSAAMNPNPNPPNPNPNP